MKKIVELKELSAALSNILVERVKDKGDQDLDLETSFLVGAMHSVAQMHNAAMRKAEADMDLKEAHTAVNSMWKDIERLLEASGQTLKTYDENGEQVEAEGYDKITFN